MDRDTSDLQSDISTLSFEGSGDGDSLQSLSGGQFIRETAIWLDENMTSLATVTASPLQDSEEMDPFVNFLEGTRFWVQKVLVPMLMVTGVIGNAITIAVMTRRRMRSSTTNNYLAALAIVDMLYLIFTFLLSLKHYSMSKQESWYWYWFTRPYCIMLADACSNSSVWLTVTFTIERFIVVSHPIKGKVWCTESRARKIITSVFLTCFAWTIPTPFEYVLRGTFDPNTNVTTYDIDISDLGRNDTYKSVYYRATVTLFIFVPLVLLTVFNFFLIRSVHVSRRTRQDMTAQSGTTGETSNGGTRGTTSTSKASKMRSVVTSSGGHVTSKLESSSSSSASNTQETKITVMLIAVVILFLICQTPTAVMLIVQTVHEFESGTKGYYLSLGLNNIFNFLVAINSAGNFLLYCFFSQRYRRTFVSIFCPCYKRRLRYLQSASNTTAYSTTANTTTASTARKKKVMTTTVAPSLLLENSNTRPHHHTSHPTSNSLPPDRTVAEEEMQELIPRPASIVTDSKNIRSSCQTVSPAEETTPFLTRSSASSPDTQRHRIPYSDSPANPTHGQQHQKEQDHDHDDGAEDALKDLPNDGIV